MRINELENFEVACNRLADMVKIDFHTSGGINNLVDKVEYYIEVKDDEISELKDTVKDLEKQVDKLEDSVKDKDDDIKDLQQKLKDREKEIDELENENSRLRDLLYQRITE